MAPSYPFWGYSDGIITVGAWKVALQTMAIGLLLSLKKPGPSVTREAQQPVEVSCVRMSDPTVRVSEVRGVADRVVEPEQRHVRETPQTRSYEVERRAFMVVKHKLQSVHQR